MENVRFFPRQVLAGTETAAADTYSDIFDVSAYPVLTVEARIYTASPANANVSVDIEQSMDPTFRADSWSVLGTLVVAAASGQGSTRTTLSNPARFVRAKVRMPIASYATMHVEAVARSSS